jgi:hypothetical protein
MKTLLKLIGALLVAVVLIIAGGVTYIMLAYPIATLNNSLFASVFIGLSALSLNVFSMRNQKTWPTIWCHYVNFLSIFALFMQ